MNKYIPEITFEKGKQLAEEAAMEEIGGFRKSNKMPVLSGEYVEAECCWVFFRNKRIQIPEGFLRNYAYAVSKKGHVILIVDFSDDPLKLKEYLKKFSDHLKEHNE
jgi:hypothetical protein